MMPTRFRLTTWLPIIAIIATLNACTSECIPCTAIQSTTFELCASDGPNATQTESTCIDITLAYITGGQ